MPNGRYVQIEDQDWVGICMYEGKRGNKIILDPKQTDNEYLDTALHELLHQLEPDWSEGKVSKYANFMSQVLVKLGYNKRLSADKP